MLLNTFAPDFALPDLNENLHHLSDYRGKIIIVNFLSAECPWSERADHRLLDLAGCFPEQVVLLPIASNPNESDEVINQACQQRGLGFILRDAGYRVADLFAAQTTPQAFIVDQSGNLRYRGAIDDVTFRKRSPERFYVQEAVEALIAGRLPEIQETPPYGCLIVRL